MPYVPNPIAFYINTFPIYWYGIIMAAALLGGITISYQIAKSSYNQEAADTLIDFAPYMVFGAIIGARLYYVLSAWHFYSSHPGEIFAIWHGGISIHGAIIGGAIASYIYLKINKMPFLKFADIVAYGLCIGQAIGRWGNYFNQEAFGLPTNLPWKIFIDPLHRPEGFSQWQYFHPAFLYESLWDILIFIILFFALRKIFKNYNGVIFFGYLILYSVGRYFIESIRLDSILNIGNIPIAQLASIVMFVFGLAGLFFCIRKGKK